MNFNELASNRISCRNYSKKSVPQEYLIKLLEAAHNAPSAGNIQPCHYYVIIDPKMIEEICSKVCSQDWIADAPVIIAACTNQNASKKRYSTRGHDVYAYLDCAAAIENLLLCATDLGLATCWIGDFNISACKKLIQTEEYTPVSLITVGYAKSTLVKSSKKPLSDCYTIIGENISSSSEDETSILEIRHSDIAHAVFDDVNLYQCSIQNANMLQADIHDVNLKEARISNSNLEFVQITDCLIEGLTINGKRINLLDGQE